MRIIDAHHHIWRKADLGWLSGPMQPRIFGPYEPIRRDYPIEEFRADIAGTGVVKSVYVQANWPVERFEDEVAWVQGEAERSGWPHAIVGYADVTVEDARPQFDRLARYPLMRGIRQQFHWHENPLYRFAADPDLCRAPAVMRNVARLKDYGWSFDLQVFAPQMDGAADLARHCPGVTFVLQHAGMLEDTSDSGIDLWRRAMTRLAREQNVVTKLSAFGTFIHRNDAGHIERMVRDAVAIFGPRRCLFGSNFPIEKLWTTYRDLLAAFLAATGRFDAADRAAIFEGNAMRTYRI